MVGPNGPFIGTKYSGCYKSEISLKAELQRSREENERVHAESGALKKMVKTAKGLLRKFQCPVSKIIWEFDSEDRVTAPYRPFSPLFGPFSPLPNQVVPLLSPIMPFRSLILLIFPFWSPFLPCLGIVLPLLGPVQP